MKSIILTIAIFFTCGLADDLGKSPKLKLIFPDVLFNNAREYQGNLEELQKEINDFMVEVQTMISGVLEKSASKTLNQYENVTRTIESNFEPVMEAFQTLKHGPCKTIAETSLNSTTQLAGFQISNCASNYDSLVRCELDNASDALNEFNNSFNEVSLIVIRSFIGKNIFLSSEWIEETFTKTYNLVKEKWIKSKIDLDLVRKGLEGKIAEQNVCLEECHDTTVNSVIVLYTLFKQQVNTCMEFENTPDPFAKSMKISSFVETIRKQKEDFEVEFAKAKAKVYAWP
ncbi:CLUMA_CG016950, isoform A [Clunio marinus]|uniref:CLUMA_CG016950, isoform A n=1 Tax=Clunio marinus TaxID=568069 RepID=A0A1J1ITW8_9DIPT|nr:CLUMA_CG016950, isoform A [Clunio marinus]